MKVCLRAGHPHHVAEAGEDHALRCARDRDAVVDPAHRDHADRAARAVDQLDVLGQEVVDRRTCRSSGCGRRRPPSACSGGRARPREDLAGERPAELGIAELVDELHAAALAIAVPAWTSSVSPPPPAAPGRSRRVSRRPSSFSQSASSRSRSTRARPASRSPTSPQVMQRRRCGRVRALTRSRSPSAPRAPARSRRPSPRASFGSRSPRPRRPWRARSRRGSAPSRRRRRPPPSSSSSPMLTLRLTPATSTLASRFDSSTTSRIWPGIARHIGPRTPLRWCRGERIT